MLVIHPDECIDCGVCEPECPADAIKADTESGLEKWLEVNTKYADIWPNITMRKDAPSDADDWLNKPGKFDAHFSDAGPVNPRFCHQPSGWKYTIFVIYSPQS